MPLILDLSFRRSAKLETYTCDNCGYTEYYADEKVIENLKLKKNHICLNNLYEMMKKNEKNW